MNASSIKAKLFYIILLWLYENRKKGGRVEGIEFTYADFDYPVNMSHEPILATYF
jgi:hypothetical protein